MQSEEPQHGFRSLIVRYMSEFGRGIAVKTAALVVAPKLAGLILAIFAIFAQVKIDWIGQTRLAIGEWTTTVKKAR